MLIQNQVFLLQRCIRYRIGINLSIEICSTSCRVGRTARPLGLTNQKISNLSCGPIKAGVGAQGLAPLGRVFKLFV
jgi:hypothetical protein